MLPQLLWWLLQLLRQLQMLRPLLRMSASGKATRAPPLHQLSLLLCAPEGGLWLTPHSCRPVCRGRTRSQGSLVLLTMLVLFYWTLPLVGAAMLQCVRV